jgi:N-methylhydantoinase B
VRVVTTGGGGWGDPLEREPDRVARDVVEGRVSTAAARDQYGVVFVADSDDGKIEEAATMRLRAEMKARRTVSSPMIDRGEGYEQMLRGECLPRTRKEA